MPQGEHTSIWERLKIPALRRTGRDAVKEGRTAAEVVNELVDIEEIAGEEILLLVGDTFAVAKQPHELNSCRGQSGEECAQ